jgi:hypothetical protein
MVTAGMLRKFGVPEFTDSIHGVMVVRGEHELRSNLEWVAFAYELKTLTSIQSENDGVFTRRSIEELQD